MVFFGRLRDLLCVNNVDLLNILIVMVSFTCRSGSAVDDSKGIATLNHAIAPGRSNAGIRSYFLHPYIIGGASGLETKYCLVVMIAPSDLKK